MTKNIDQRIADALASGGDLEELGHEPNLSEEMIQAFRGRRRWLSRFVFCWSFLLFGLCVVCAIRFFQADTVEAQLRWGAGALLFILAVSFSKIWFWMEMQTNRVLRELKRVELLLVQRLERDD